ncbi:1-acyl-sn-glycerol-3-phosphate acyltransferase [Robertkochia aurantiaca]|uniref:1-acyl-sn-glycerol-3-phosphate acyltransferase n=1 Tax=Robertkochia aurantiaca TaxID=2873700 RepID=UPI0021049C5A|nr:1-acyl-sn-glycerol-3-phosphate acyltransferase [Robertkochia sp. 3YJGBD-33]
MITKEDIRPYRDEEVHDALMQYESHPLFSALLNFTFPEKSSEEISELLDSCRSIHDFQTRVVYHSIQVILDKSSEGFSHRGFNKLDKDRPYLFISNHRDIVLDTSLLNVVLIDEGMITTASAIGDNLVRKSFLMALSRLNRNFLIKRDQSPRERLRSSMVVSDYIRELLLEKQRSVWIAQREGRTKDGDDRTQQGVLKMLGLANKDQAAADYFRELRIVPVSISYEYDPTDILKMPELMARHYDQEYVKSSNEDFNSILKGAAGNKKRIHIEAGPVLDSELDRIFPQKEASNVQYQELAEYIDHQIYRHYRLWPSNYIAYDLLHDTAEFQARYDEKEKRQFERRILRRVDQEDPAAIRNFLRMYANPVINKLHNG